jgi:2-polyprenyl-3-methyl-5-hydroxy-6-metoxy-1,4-benzoquinol methylase
MNYEHLYQDKKDTYYGHDRNEIFPYIPENLQTALDIGCGNGAFGSLLKAKRSCTVWGIEPNSVAAVAAEKKLDRVINGLFSKDMPELASEKFDAIFFNDVLEHLIEPGETLIDCKNLLNVNGCIVASIPNVRWYPVVLSLLRYRDFKYEEAGVMDKTHLRFFTLKSMYRLFEDSGYRVVKAVGINKTTDFKYFNILNFLLFKSQEDMKFPQFVIVASL